MIVKVGDRIRILRDTNCHGFKIGDTPTVCDISKSIHGYWLYKCRRDGYMWTVKSTDVELVVEEPLDISKCRECHSELEDTGIPELPYECSHCRTLYTKEGVMLSNKLAV